MENQDWGQANEEISVEAMDSFVQDYREKRQAYEKLKEETSKLYHAYEEAEKKVVNALMSTGKTKYFVDGIGTVSIKEKKSFKVPPDVESKAKLFAYIKDTYGQDTLISYLSIHSQTLNSFAKKETEERRLETLPGLQAPSISTELSFRKD